MSQAWRRQRVALIALAHVVASLAFGQATDTTRRAPPPALQPVVVTATRVAFPAVTSATTVITGNELREQGIVHLADAIRTVPSLTVVQTGSFGGLTSVYPRGGESGYTRVLIDGVPVNDAGGDFNFATLTTADVDRIEIVRGPSSVLYGTDAVGAVIQIFTRSGIGAPRFTVGAGGGSFAATRAEAGVAGGTSAVSFGFHAGRFRTDGIHEFNSDYHQSVASGIVRLAVDSQTNGRIFVRYADDRVHIPTDGAGNVVDRNAVQSAQRLTTGLEITRLIDKRFDVQVSAAAHITDGGFDDASDHPGDTLGFFAFHSLDHTVRRSVDARANVRLRETMVLTAGGMVEQQTQRSFNESLSEFGPSHGSFDVRRINRAVFTQGIGTAGLVAWNLGARLDQSDAFGRFTTYRGGLAVAAPGGVRVRAAAGTAFREPSLFQNYATGFVRGNPSLRPERTQSWEVGADYALAAAGLEASVTWFDQRFSNLIEYTGSPAEPDDPNFFNVASATARGLESELRWSPTPAGVYLAAGYAYTDSRTRRPGLETRGTGLFRAGEPLLRRPMHSASTTVGIRSGRGSLVGRLTYVGAREDVDFSRGERVSLPGHATVDLSAWIPIVRAPDGAVARLAVFARVANAFDRQYDAVVGYRSPGRTIQAGANAGF